MEVQATPVVEPREVILAADDNEQNLELLSEYLWQWGYDVVPAIDGREAVRLFAEVKPSLVILDVMMPVMNGYEACESIKSSAAGRSVPIIMLTALTSSDDKVRALEFGADDFLNKPINRDELRARVQALLKIRNLRKELDSSETILITLTAALESKDPASRGHLHRVAEKAGLICDGLGIQSSEKDTVVTGALLHDLGMLGVSDEILQKTGPLNSEEEMLLRMHPKLGASILEPLTTFRQYIPIVRSHHENFDGSGYPDGLRGEAIPLAARIVGVANRYDDLLHDDPDCSPALALSRLREECVQGLHDPNVVGALAGDRRSTPVMRITPIIPRAKPRILCVDDSRLNRQLLAQTLAETGMHTLQAENGLEALQVLGREPVDLVLLDLMMPQLTGEETLHRMRADPRFELVPVIVLTAQRTDDYRKRAIVAGADDYMRYPLNRLELTTRIKSLLRISEYQNDLEQSQNVICTLALAIEAKDRYTRGHSQRVGELAFVFSRYAGLSDKQAENVRTAGLLHDIGKIAVPESLLNKPGPLTQDEFLRVIDHPVVGEAICRPLLSLRPVLRLIRHHHERFDGRGYPDGLKGDDIPVDVRILSIVDAYDALTSHRAYRIAPLPHSSALETLFREAAAGKWDPALVHTFSELLGDAPPDYAAITRSTPAMPSL